MLCTCSPVPHHLTLRHRSVRCIELIREKIAEHQLFSLFYFFVVCAPLNTLEATKKSMCNLFKRRKPTRCGSHSSLRIFDRNTCAEKPNLQYKLDKRYHKRLLVEVARKVSCIRITESGQELGHSYRIPKRIVS